jgi:hypothetical protein
VLKAKRAIGPHDGCADTRTSLKAVGSNVPTGDRKQRTLLVFS